MTAHIMRRSVSGERTFGNHAVPPVQPDMRRPLARFQRQFGRREIHHLIIGIQPFLRPLPSRPQKARGIFGQIAGIKRRLLAAA
jgi:hypothetical protein